MQVKQDEEQPKELKSFLDFELVDVAAPSENAGQSSARCLLTICTREMLLRAVRWGKNRPFFMDTTFGIARYKFSFLTILVMNDECHGVPVCWAFLPNEQEATIKRVLDVFRSALLAVEPSFTCSAFLTDDCSAEQNAAR